jgi:3-oxoacyl-[acyl-carrier protein] reductase
MKILSGKVALITGASRGIGAATALALANAGASIYLTADGTHEELSGWAESCREASDTRAEFGMFDLAKSDHVQRMVNTAVSSLGRVDILINNAGIRIPHPFGEFTSDEFDRLMSVNLRAAFLASQAALIYMIKAMALELARDRIMVNTVSPGPIETEFNRSRMERTPGFKELRESQVPLGRWGKPEEVAETILFLASTTATFIQGSNLVIDGGYLTQ